MKNSTMSTFNPNASMGGIPDNLFYKAYSDGAGVRHVVLTSLLLNCVGLPGFLMNLSVVLVTIRHRSLHGSANFLLAWTSLFEMGHEAGHLLFLWMALISGQHFLSYLRAFWLLCVPIFCVGGIFASMFSTGLDRLLCVLLPRIHSGLNSLLYLGAHCLLSVGVGLWLWLQFWECAKLYPDYPVTGYISDLIIGQCGPAYTYSSFGFNLGTILLYLVVGVLIRVQSNKINPQSLAVGQQHSHQHQSSTSQRLFRSLLIIILANIGGYFFVSIMRAFVLPALQLNAVVEWYVNSYDGILLNVSSACNAPVLYLLSRDYRAAFDKELTKLPRIRLERNANCPHQTQQPTTVIVVSSTQRRQSQRPSGGMRNAKW